MIAVDFLDESKDSRLLRSQSARWMIMGVIHILFTEKLTNELAIWHHRVFLIYFLTTSCLCCL